MTDPANEPHEGLERWGVQLRKGVLEFVVLLSLRGREQYGFELIGGIRERASLDLPEGTIYPLLLRLSKDGLVASRLADGGGGAARKYYRLTPRGAAMLGAMTRSWDGLSASVGRMMEEDA